MPRGSNNVQTFPDLDGLAQHLRSLDKKVTLIFASNGTGNTRLSMAFKELGKQRNGEAGVTARNTLYFNAFTEDLCTCDNGLANDRERVLKMNTISRFFGGPEEHEMEARIPDFLDCYTDYQFGTNYQHGTIRFWSEILQNDNGDGEPVLIKVSRGEENMFIWCFFLAIVKLAIDGQGVYDWVTYFYIDDSISSLDGNNAIAVAAQLAKMLKEQDRLRAVISSHHTLFFNVLCNELPRAQRYFLRRNAGGCQLLDTASTPCFYHVAMLKELHEDAESDQLYTYHFTILRSILEKTATFHGFNNFGDILRRDPNDEDGTLHARYVNLLSHENYSLFEPMEMLEENKRIFSKILEDFMSNYRFNPKRFPEVAAKEANKRG